VFRGHVRNLAPLHVWVSACVRLFAALVASAWVVYVWCLFCAWHQRTYG